MVGGAIRIHVSRRSRTGRLLSVGSKRRAEPSATSCANLARSCSPSSVGTRPRSKHEVNGAPGITSFKKSIVSKRLDAILPDGDPIQRMRLQMNPAVPQVGRDRRVVEAYG